jgi:hypothetical protein
MPDPGWPTPPRGWTFWVVDRLTLDDAGDSGMPRFGTPPRTTAATYGTYGTYGTDRGSWLAGLRARASSDALTVAPGVAVEPVATRAAAESSWELDGLLTSAGRLDL